MTIAVEVLYGICHGIIGGLIVVAVRIIWSLIVIKRKQ